jgi:ketosteroid isomerase-like protein
MTNHLNFDQAQAALDAARQGDYAPAFDAFADDVTTENGPGAGPWHRARSKDDLALLLLELAASFGDKFHQDGHCVYADDRVAISLIHETGTAPGGDPFDNLAVYVSRDQSSRPGLATTLTSKAPMGSRRVPSEAVASDPVVPRLVSSLTGNAPRLSTRSGPPGLLPAAGHGPGRGHRSRRRRPADPRRYRGDEIGGQGMKSVYIATSRHQPTTRHHPRGQWGA